MARNKYDVDETLQSEFNGKDFKRLISYGKPYYKSVIFTVLIMLISSIAALFGPYMVEIAIDYKIPQKDIKGLVILSILYALSLVVTGICLKLKIRIMNNIGQSMIERIRKDIFDKLQELPFSYYDSRPHGKILVRVVNYVNSLSDLLSNGIVNTVTDLFSLIVIIVFMLVIDARLTLICLAGLPVLFLIVMTIKNAQRKAFQILSSKQSNLNAYIHESICGMKVTQSFARENENHKIFNELSENYRSSWMKAVSIQFLLGPSTEIVSILTTAAIYVVGISLLGTSVKVGVLVAFIGYLGRFWAPINNIGTFYNSIITAMAYLERIFETIDEEPMVKNIPGATLLKPIVGEVEFKDVSFSYEDGVRILSDINFKAKVGNCIALVGPTGAGKTTIVNLISRFYDLEAGEVLIDGADIKKVTLESLRRQMGIMLQDSFIFSGNIIDNIRYGRLDATDEEVIKAAKAVKAHDFIMAMTEGYNTQVNERGARLSVGQRQLISFARALLANPRILILDEATSSIDTKTEIALQKGLERLLKGRTSFIIAHRLSTIKNADSIMYIDKGRIMEKGSHEELMKLEGHYYKLYSSQYSMLEAI
ncbi:MAG TPA: ABC transporter ATP-binding protein [Clostridiaceae bacterium]